MKGKKMGLKRNRNRTSIDVKSNTKISPRKSTVLVNISSYLKEYCSTSGVHGFRYLSDGRNVFERLFWLAAIALSIYGCSMMVTKIKTKMETTPVIVTIAENPTKTYHVPFPAVTICPGWVVRLTAFNFTKYLQLTTQNRFFSDDFLSWLNERNGSKDRDYNASEFSDYNDELPWLRDATLRRSLYKKLWALRTITYNKVSKGPNAGNGTVELHEEDMDFLVEVAPKMNKGIVFKKQLGNNFMRWKSLFYNLDEHFKHLWTEFGVCYTFNMMGDSYVFRDGLVNNEVFKRKGLNKHFSKPFNDWDPDKGYFNVLRVETYPWRAPHERSRLNNALIVMMTDNEDDMEGFAGKRSVIYKVLFHQPQDHPIVGLNNFISMPYDKVLDLTIRINVMTTSPELEKYDPHKRQCYYSHEKHLEYFKFYSRNNCQLECLTNVSLRACGCVQFYMPRYNTTKICGVDSLECYTDALKQSDENEINATLKHLSGSGTLPFNSANINEECDCLPNCLTITYNADVLTTRELNLDILRFSTTAPPKPGERLVPAGMWVRMESTLFTAIQRTEYYGQVDFLANCGGFFGLFCGFSILSFIEIFYFLTIRLWTNIYERLVSRRSSVVPGGVSDGEDPNRRSPLNSLPSVDVSLRSSYFTRACARTNIPAESQRGRTNRQKSNAGQHWDEIVLHGFRK